MTKDHSWLIFHISTQRRHIQVAVKDMNLAVPLARELGVPVELGETTEAIITRFRDDGDRGEDDMNEIIRDYTQRSGLDI